MEIIAMSLITCACIWGSVKLSISRKSSESKSTVHSTSDGNFLIIYEETKYPDQVEDLEEAIGKMSEQYLAKYGNEMPADVKKRVIEARINGKGAVQVIGGSNTAK